MMEEWEIEAALMGGKMGGEYLESIGKTDLAALSAEEWRIFLECVCKEFAIQRNLLQPCPF